MKSKPTTWKQAVGEVVKKLPIEFTTNHIYGYEEVLARAFPGNNNVRAKIRQQLQLLRDDKVLKQGRKPGQWKRNVNKLRFVANTKEAA